MSKQIMWAAWPWAAARRSHPVHVQYRDGGRGGHGGADPPAGAGGLRDHPRGGAGYGGGAGRRAYPPGIHIPLVADIHFDYRLALECVRQGIDKIRINPGNIGSQEKVRAVADACRSEGIPIRIGVNGGSLERELLQKYGGVTPEALVESAMGHVRLLNDCNFDDICISVKCSRVPVNMAAYQLLHRQTDYPLHLGVTEAGTPRMGVLKSAIGIGGLLCMGIGDTLRVSLTADPVEEVVRPRISSLPPDCGRRGRISSPAPPAAGQNTT